MIDIKKLTNRNVGMRVICTHEDGSKSIGSLRNWNTVSLHVVLDDEKDVGTQPWSPARVDWCDEIFEVDEGERFVAQHTPTIEEDPEAYGQEQCENCDSTGQVHSHNPTCWVCKGKGYTPKDTTSAEKMYAVAYIDWYQHDLIVEFHEATDPFTAITKHSALQYEDSQAWLKNLRELSTEDLKQAFFDMDSMIDVKEVPQSKIYTPS